MLRTTVNRDQTRYLPSCCPYSLSCAHWATRTLNSVSLSSSRTRSCRRSLRRFGTSPHECMLNGRRQCCRGCRARVLHPISTPRVSAYWMAVWYLEKRLQLRNITNETAVLPFSTCNKYLLVNVADTDNMLLIFTANDSN